MQFDIQHVIASYMGPTNCLYGIREHAITRDVGHNLLFGIWIALMPGK